MFVFKGICWPQSDFVDCVMEKLGIMLINVPLKLRSICGCGGGGRCWNTGTSMRLFPGVRTDLKGFLREVEARGLVVSISRPRHQLCMT